MLRFTAVAFVAANLLHTADHFRQGVGDLTFAAMAIRNMTRGGREAVNLDTHEPPPPLDTGMERDPRAT